MNFIATLSAAFILLTTFSLHAGFKTDELVEAVLEKAQKIKFENPRFNNRDLIQAFFAQNPELQAREEPKIINNKAVVPKKIAVLGAGPSGLIAALILARDGHQVTVYEKRSEAEFALRWQNVSLNVPDLIKSEFLELNTIFEKQQLIQYEMELNDSTKIRSFRIAIGDLQQALSTLCLKWGVAIRYGENRTLEHSGDAQIVIVATGAKTLEWLESQELKVKFNYQSFEQYKTHGIAGIRYDPESKAPVGFHKERIVDKDHNWGFNVTIVGAGVSSQAARLALINPTATKFTMTSNNPAIHWYIYSAKKEANLSALPFAVDEHSYVDFVPSFSTDGVILHEERAVILWGDARTSSHPLTGAGLAIPFLSAQALSQFVGEFGAVEDSLASYNRRTAPLARELFIKTILVTLF